MTLVERFTRVDAETLDYQFTVDDPGSFTRSWTAAVPMMKTEGPIFEYACHEGNYGMTNLLSRRAPKRSRVRLQPDPLSGLAGLDGGIHAKADTWGCRACSVVRRRSCAGASHLPPSSMRKNRSSCRERSRKSSGSTHTWIHIDVKKPDGTLEQWMIRGARNTLFRRGVNKNSLPAGAMIVVDGYQAKDGTLRGTAGHYVSRRAQTVHRLDRHGRRRDPQQPPPK